MCDLCTLEFLNKKVPNKDGEDYRIPDVIRRSHLNTYMACPYKFYMEVIKNMPSPHTIYTQMGVDIHELLDKASNDPSYTERDMHDEFMEYWNEYPSSFFDSEQQKQAMYERAMNSIKHSQKYLEELGKPFCSEEKLVFSIHPDLPSISTTADRVDNFGSNLQVLDWKTGKPLVGQKLSSDIQAPLYIYAIQEHFDRQVDRFTFAYLDKDTTRVFDRINDDEFECKVRNNSYKISLSKTVNDMTKVLTNIKNGKFDVPNNTQGMYFTCKMCHLVKEGACKGNIMQSWG